MEKKTKKDKYNVKSDEKSIKKRTFDEVIFDSEMEMKFYRDVLVPEQIAGKIIKIVIQPKFLLQPSYEKYGRKILPMYYVGDFLVVYSDYSEIVYDVKGMIPEPAKMKRKIWDYVYPDKVLKWITLSIKYGGWIETDKLQNLRRKDKKQNGKKDI